MPKHPDTTLRELGFRLSAEHPLQGQQELEVWTGPAVVLVHRYAPQPGAVNRGGGWEVYVPVADTVKTDETLQALREWVEARGSE